MDDEDSECEESLLPLKKRKLNDETFKINVTNIEDLSDASSESGSENETENENENENLPRRLPIPNVDFSREHLLSRDDNIAHFVSADCVVSTEIGKQLHNAGLMSFENLIELTPEVYEVFLTSEGGKRVFSLIVKQKHTDQIELKNVIKCLQHLRKSMPLYEVDTVNISKNGDDLDNLPWHPVEQGIRNIFQSGNSRIVICTDEVRIPLEESRELIISEAHDSTAGGHKGITKTLRRIKTLYFWKGMKRDVIKFIKTCESCQRKKLVRKKTRIPMAITDTPTEALDKIQMDIVGPLIRTPSGNAYILTIQDNLTKYLTAVPLVNTDALTIATAFIENFILVFGCPKNLHTDQGANFLSDIMKRVAKILKITQLKSTAYHPQSLGSLERAHHVIIEYLKHFTNKNDWDNWIKPAIFSYNTSVHEQTQFTPHELMFGKQARIPSEFIEEKVENTYNLYLDNLFQRITDTQALAAARLNLAKEKSKRLYDRKVNNQNFKVNDKVYLLKEPKDGKFSDQYTGPYEIINIPNEFNAEIKLKNGRIKQVHFNKLKYAYTRA